MGPCLLVKSVSQKRFIVIRSLPSGVSAEGRFLHPYDVLAHPKRRKILGLLEGRELTYTELMKEVGIEDSGKLSYHLGALSRYIQHQDDLYSLSIEGRVLSAAVQEFEKRSYGLMGDMTGSIEVDPDGLLKATYSVRFSLLTAEGDLIQRGLASGFDKTKAESAMQANVDKLDLGIRGMSVEPGKDGLCVCFEHEAKGFVEKDGWMIAKEALHTLNLGDLGDKTTTSLVPGLHMHIRGSTVYPEGAIVERDYPQERSLEQEGIQVFELAQSEAGQRWRVAKGGALCIGESRLETEGGTTREIVELETHAVAQDPSIMADLVEDVRALPVLVSGKTRFRMPTVTDTERSAASHSGNAQPPRTQEGGRIRAG